MNLWLKSSSYSSSWLIRSKPLGAKGAIRQWSIFLKHKDPEHKQTLQAHSYKFPCFVKPSAIPMIYSWYITQDNIWDILCVLFKTSENKHNNHWHHHYQADVLWTFLDPLYCVSNLNGLHSPWYPWFPWKYIYVILLLKTQNNKKQRKQESCQKA